MTHSTIVSRFLSPRLSAIVQEVEGESDQYTRNPRMHGRPGFLRRDRLRFLLTDRAYKRFSRTL